MTSRSEGGEKIISVEEMRNIPVSQLKDIYTFLNMWEWSELLGNKPDGWDEMSNHQKPYMGECVTKEDIIRPYMNAISTTISHGEIYSASMAPNELKF